MDEEKKDDYSLYTEYIVTDKWKRVKNICRKVICIILAAAIFGAIAGLVMITVYRNSDSRKNEEPSKPSVTLDSSDTTEDETESIEQQSTDEETTASVYEWDQEIKEGINNVAGIYSSLKAVADRINLSSVTVRTSSVDMVMDNSYRNTIETYGVVIAIDSYYCYILTSYNDIKGADKIEVTFSNGEKASGSYCAGDDMLGYAVFSTSIPDTDMVQSVRLGSSGSVHQGDVLVAVGDLYDCGNTFSYGTITGTSKKVSDTDASYTLVNTNIAGSSSSMGVVTNLNGQVIGLITTKYDNGKNNYITAYAITGIRSIIENLANGIQRPYAGIVCSEVTQKMNESGDMPNGIYVESVNPGSPAYSAGIVSGDIITEVGGSQTATMSSFIKAVTSAGGGTPVDIQLERLGKDGYRKIVYSVTLGVK